MVARWIAVSAALVILAACGPGAADGTKAGSEIPPIILQIGADGDASLPSGRAISALARYVAEQSDGSLVLEPVWQPAGPDEPRWDQWLARAVKDRELDLGVIPARAWDVEGVDSFRALYAPFLATNHELLAKATTGALADDMLAGLDDYGVTGLALVPHGMRYLFTMGDPLRTPKDFAGQTIRSPLSETTYALFRALGASPRPLVGGEYARALEDRNVAAIESAYAWSEGLPGQPVALGDLPLYPAVDTIVINSATGAALSTEHRRILLDGARYARDWAIDNTPSEAAAATAHCDGTGAVAHVGSANIRSFRTAAEQVYDELEADPETARRIAAIRELSAGGEPDVAPPCDSVGSSPRPEQEASTSAAEKLDGTFRTPEWTVAGLIDAGFTAEQADQLAGVFSFTFDNGSIQLNHRGASFQGGLTCPGTYGVSGDEVAIALTETGPCGTAGPFLTATFEVTDTTLRFLEIDAVHPDDEILFGGIDWLRIPG